MLDCPNPPPVTVVLDPYDDVVVHTRAALASHAPQQGRLTIHPTPGTDAAIALAYDILAALGKPVPLAGYRPLDQGPAWSVAAAWILATPITHLTLLRAHLLTPHRFRALLALRRRTGVRLILVCHHRAMRVFLERELRQVDQQHCRGFRPVARGRTGHPLATAHVRDLGPDGTTITLHDRGLRRGCMTHPVPAWASPLLRAAALLRRIGSSTSGPLFSDPLGGEGLPSLMAFAEDCRLRPPQPPCPKPRRSRRGPAPRVKEPAKTIWPVCTAHYGLSWARDEPDLMQGYPYPPPHTRKTIERRKKGWLPPDYGLRELRHLR
ncbi:hypothetical protein [Streptomyces bambusae]|uniref:Uncharacterized protein n=1 Tax=Streptomyces bambusae TaxID=1550616 RepID=A0ABS6Z256_9ACTN|nr:hypothetical protein [Streptomyces bambusae]MBW5481828.1 hypothetical protein [Streptomyces bambusae]